MVDMMDLDELTARYASIYGGFESWDQLLVDVRANLYEARALDLLVADLRSAGSFREPVVLGLVEEGWDSDYDEAGEGDAGEGQPTVPIVHDGTKRILAHMAAGVQQVKVEDLKETPFVLGANLGRYQVSTRVEISLPLTNREPALSIPVAVDQESELDFWDGLLSLRVNDEVWLSVLTSGSQHEGELLWYSLVWDDKALRVSHDEIKVAVLEQLATFGFETDRVQVSTKIEDWGGDAPVEIEQELLHHMLSGFGDPTA